MAATPATRVRTLYPPVAREEQGLRAGVVTRTTVMVIDAALVAAGVGVAYLVWAVVRFMRHPARFAWPQLSFRMVVVLWYVLCFIYLSVTWSTTGRSVGKRFLGLRVVNRAGRVPAFGLSLVRAAMCVFFPMLLFWSAVSRENRSVQDLVLRTSVIYDWRARPPDGSSASDDDALGVAVDVAAPVADEPHDGEAEPLGRVDGE
jgi:uncharacterized RDD family membrane protein YckC